MRFGIVYDDNGVILAASVSGDAADPVPGPGMSNGQFNVPDDMPEAEQRQVVERVLIDMDPRSLCRKTARTSGGRKKNVEMD
jgi:hypothetical protein